MLHFGDNDRVWCISLDRTIILDGFCRWKFALHYKKFHLQNTSTISSSECDAQNPDIYTHTPYNAIISPKYELAVTVQLVEALHRNRRAAGSIPARGLTVSFFATAPSKVK